MSDPRTVPISEVVGSVTEQLAARSEAAAAAMVQGSLVSLIRKLSDRELIHRKHYGNKKQGGAEITFVPHYHTASYLDLVVGLWEWEVVSITVGESRLFLIGKLTIHGTDGKLSRSATGTELLSKDSFGDPSSNAEAMAFNRCAMKFGFARHLWSDKGFKPKR